MYYSVKKFIRYFLLVKKNVFSRKVKQGGRGEKSPQPLRLRRPSTALVYPAYKYNMAIGQSALVKMESGLISFVGASMFQQSQLNNFIMSFWKFSLNTHFVNFEVREECHSKFEDPVPDEKKNHL